MGANLNHTILKNIEDYLKDGGTVFNFKSYRFENKIKFDDETFLGHFKRNRVPIDDHDRFVIGWQHSQRDKAIFDLVVFLPATVEARCGLVHDLLPTDIEILESRGVEFYPDTYQYKELKKLIVLGNIGS